MIIKRIAGATHMLGRSQGYLGLPVRYEEVNCSVNGERTPSYVTAWEPTPDEIELIKRGAPVYLRIVGLHHPPVMVWAGKPPTQNKEDA